MELDGVSLAEVRDLCADTLQKAANSKRVTKEMHNVMAAYRKLYIDGEKLRPAAKALQLDTSPFLGLRR